MTTEEAKQKKKEAGKKWEDFQEWMLGQTYGVNKDGNADWYDIDVDFFIKGFVPFG